MFSASEKEKECKVDSSPPKSRIPVANFRYPNKSDLRSAENSPKKAEAVSPREEVEYQNIVNERSEERQEKSAEAGEREKEKEEAPPPIPSLPVSARTLVADAYYEKLMAEHEIQQVVKFIFN